MYQPAAPPGHIYGPYAQPPPHMMLHGYHPSQYMSVSAPYMNGYGNPGVYNVGVPMASFNPPEATQPPKMPTIETVQPAATRQRLPVPEQAKIAKPPAADSRKKVPQARDESQAALEAKQKVSMASDSSSDSEGEPEEEGICTAEPGTVLYDWPNGKRVRKFETEDEAKPNNDQAKWQFRSYGTSNWNRKATEYSVAIGKAKTSKCLGVDVCPNPACVRPVKPKTDPSTQEKQIHAGCALCGSGPLVHHDCAARCHRYRAKDIKTGEEYFRWEHEGYHDHPRPPTSHLSVSETAQLDAQVVRGGANATVHALRTGDLNPGSVPLPDIAPALANPSAARYFVAKSQARTGVTNTMPKNTTAGATIKQILGLNGELGEPFLIFSQLHDQGLFIFRTAFMNSVLEATVDDWVLDKDTVGSRHGFVTDGNHSYFKDGVLLSTSAFSETLKAWVPVLFTLVFGEDAAHHRPHFKHLNDAVMAKVQRDGLPFKKEYLLNVMDFSQAQRNAHAELSSSGHHSALCWIQPMIEDFEPCFEAQRYMAVQYSVESACGAGHRCTQYPERPKAIMHPHCEYAAALQKLLKMDTSIGLEEYFSNLAVILPNQELHPSIAAGQTPCATDGCELNAAPSAVNFYWPLILTVGSNLSDGKRRAHNHLRFDETFKIISPDSEIVYTLVGRIIHKKDHFTAELMLGGVSYTYDDMNSRLRRAKKGTHPLQKRTTDESYYVYHRTSQLGKTTQSIQKMKDNFHHYERVSSVGSIPKRPLSVSDGSSSGSDIEMGSTPSKSSRSDGTVYDNDFSSEDEPLIHSIFESKSLWDDDIDGPTETNTPGPSNKPGPSTSLSDALALWDKVAKAKAKPAASVTADIAIPSCETCGLDGAAALSTILCHLYHLDDIDFLFCCPQCRLGRFLLVNVHQITRLNNRKSYPAQIISRTNDTVTLQWHKYNDWPQKSPVMVSDTFTLSVQECYSMLWRDDFATDLPNSLGSIVWPIVLYDITSEEDVEALWEADSLGILSALKDAETAIVEFVTGIRYHPIMNVLMEWMEELPLSTPKRHFARKKHLLRFPSKMFSIPLFPGHRAAIDNYISMTFTELLAGKEEEHICVVVLLRLLVLRKYLKLEPSDDAEIFELSRILTEKEYSMTTENDIATRSRIQRLLTTHERAFYCNRANLLGNSTLDPTPQITSSTIASEDWSMNTHLLKGHSQIQRKIGDVPVEHPANLIRILTEDGSPYIMGTFVHDYKDDMALFGSTPYPLKTRPPRDPALGPEPFPFNPNEPPATLNGESTFRVIQPSKPVPSTPKPKPKKKEQEKLAHLPAPVPVATRLTRKVTMDQRLQTEKRRGEGESDEEFIPGSKKRAKKHHVS
ncbi:hypothetical protein D9611_014780 [Ephemerocybe angulata]|uniref:GCM domain-containing protein n=1 Tax=Ephemerocybe angulata TaxID=980116 RepID=A0A8H5FIC4_9AGAR|nr:hypothetical protein D9611_014780 [Tulosesus angulatus]